MAVELQHPYRNIFPRCHPGLGHINTSESYMPVSRRDGSANCRNSGVGLLSVLYVYALRRCPSCPECSCMRRRHSRAAETSISALVSGHVTSLGLRYEQLPDPPCRIQHMLVCTAQYGTAQYCTVSVPAPYLVNYVLILDRVGASR
jgi:hypothetical protein